MDANEIIEAIHSAKKKTPVTAYIKASRPLYFENCHVFTGADMIVKGDWADIEPVLERNRDAIDGRPRAFNRRFGLSRINLRNKAHRGELPGVMKSSW